MTTAFTHALVEHDLTFEQFVWRCASAFDFLARRHDAYDVAIDALPNDSHERKRLDEAQSELEAFRIYDEQGRLEALQYEYAYTRKILKRASEENAKTDAKLDAMAERIREWQVPDVEPLPELKDFMLSQLKMSKCLPFNADIPEPTAADVERRMETLERRVEKIREELRQIAVNYARRKAWIAALLNSVPKPEEG